MSYEVHYGPVQCFRQEASFDDLEVLVRRYEELNTDAEQA